MPISDCGQRGVRTCDCRDSSLTIDSLDDNEEYFTFINGNAFVNSPVIHKRGNVIWGKNPGYVTENSGVATIAGGQTQIVVAHGLAAAAHTVHVTPAGNLGQAAKFWVDEIGEREFTIKLDAAPGADTPFHWHAVITGIVPADKKIDGLSEFRGTENPAAPVYVPDKPGIKVGIYHKGIAAKELVEALNRESDMNAFILPRMDSDTLNKCNVFILPKTGYSGYVEAGIPVLTAWVANGGGALLLHGALDWLMFPEVGTSGDKVRFDVTQRRHSVRPGIPHPITAGMSTNDWFEPSFQFDHVTLKPGPDGTAAIVDDEGAPVLVTGPSGKGRVALNGMMLGVVGARNEPGGRNRQAPEGAEWELFLNTVRWLAGDKLSAK